MGAPLINVLVGAAMVLSAFAFGKHRAALSKKRARLPYLLLPRFFLISSLLEKLDKLPQVVGSLHWSDFEIQLSSVLHKIRLRLEEVVGTEEPTTQLHRDIISCGDDDGTGNPSISGSEWKSKLEQLTALMDGQLVPLLRSQPGLAQLFRQYVPAERQSWHEFVEQVLPSDDERQIIESEAANLELQNHLSASCLHQVIALQEQLKLLMRDELRRGGPGGASDDGRLVSSKRYKVVKVFYATDRRVTEDGDYVGSLRTSDLHYGFMEVGIPEAGDDVAGSVDASAGSLEEFCQLEHVVILSRDTKCRGNRTMFMESINLNMRESASEEVLIFIHGYNVTLIQAVKRAAQLKHDLNFKGTVIAYSWSSKGDLWGYFQDSKNVKTTVPSLHGFLVALKQELVARHPIARVHVLAHSMGNRALIRALTTMFDELQQGTFLSHIVLAAADDKPAKFQALMKSIQQNSPSSPPAVTVYTSTKDLAICVSKRVNFAGRLGNTRSILRLWSTSNSSEGHDYDLVDATGVDVTLLGHSYYGDVPEVIDDLRLLIGGCRAQERTKLHHISYMGRCLHAFRDTVWQHLSQHAASHE